RQDAAAAGAVILSRDWAGRRRLLHLSPAGRGIGGLRPPFLAKNAVAKHRLCREAIRVRGDEPIESLRAPSPHSPPRWGEAARRVRGKRLPSIRQTPHQFRRMFSSFTSRAYLSASTCACRARFSGGPPTGSVAVSSMRLRFASSFAALSIS